VLPGVQLVAGWGRSIYDAEAGGWICSPCQDPDVATAVGFDDPTIDTEETT